MTKPVAVEIAREPVHVVVERMRIYLAVLALVISGVSGASAFLVTSATSGLSGQLAHVEARAVQDSVRFERTIEVVELAVIALVEDEGSEARSEAISELRRRRHVSQR